MARGQYAPTSSVYSKEARLIPGFKEGLLEMSIGDKATLFIPSIWRMENRELVM